MTDTVEDDVRMEFRRIAEPVVPRPDPLGRLLARRRRRRWQRGLGAAAAAVAVALTGGTLALAPVGGPVDPPQPSPDRSVQREIYPGKPKSRMDLWTRRLVDSPTRGDLAGDPALVAAVAAAAAANPGVPPGQNRVKVLAVGTANRQRYVLVAYHNDEYVTVNLAYGAADAAPADLAKGDAVTRGSGWLPLRPIFVSANDLTIALAPSGCSLDSSDTTAIGPDGVAQRTWVTHGDHLIDGLSRPAGWWRVTCEGTVRFAGPVDYPQGWDSGSPGTPDGASADERLVTVALDGWRRATRHLGGDQPTVRWTGPTGDGRTTTVVTGTGWGGRTLVTATTSAAGERMKGYLYPMVAAWYAGREPYRQEPWNNYQTDDMASLPLGTATAAPGDPLVVRLPNAAADDTAPVLSRRILIVPPASASKVTVAGTELDIKNGVVVVNIPEPAADLTITVGGATVHYREPRTTGQFFGEELIDNWGA